MTLALFTEKNYPMNLQIFQMIEFTVIDIQK